MNHQSSSFSNNLRPFWVLLFIVFVLLSGVSAFSQKADHLSEMEIELIRLNQALDERIEIYLKAIDRRFLTINGTDSLTEKERKKLERDSEKWGELPTGSVLELLRQIESILDEAIIKIDDVAGRDTKSNIFANAVHLLSDGSKLLLPRFEHIYKDTKNPAIQGSISRSVNYCEMIIEASSKIAKPEPKKRKKKK